MTQDEIIEMAKQCGCWNGETCEMNDVGLEAFAKLVAAKEREACAVIADNMDACQDGEIGKAIRARGEA